MCVILIQHTTKLCHIGAQTMHADINLRQNSNFNKTDVKLKPQGQMTPKFNQF